MSTLWFHKYQGTGNDFLIGDNRSGLYTNLTAPQIQRLCDRRFGIGADGLILLESEADKDFSMRYFNADGHPGSFCGNGARCITQFAHYAGIAKDEYIFSAVDGDHRSRRDQDGTVSVLMQSVTTLLSHDDAVFVDTGSPHLVVAVEDLDNTAVEEVGRSIRNSDRYREKGININFVQRTDDPGTIRVRTYERGVENETYSCGTGAVAAALVFAADREGEQLICVQTRGGDLLVRFAKEKARYSAIWLCGPALIVFETTLDPQQF
jgi:diaminopimelate epimerase